MPGISVRDRSRRSICTWIQRVSWKKIMSVYLVQYFEICPLDHPFGSPYSSIYKRETIRTPVRHIVYIKWYTCTYIYSCIYGTAAYGPSELSSRGGAANTAAVIQHTASKMNKKEWKIDRYSYEFSLALLLVTTRCIV